MLAEPPDVFVLLEGFKGRPSVCKKRIALRTIDNETYWWNHQSVRDAIQARGLRPRLGYSDSIRGGENLLIVAWIGARRVDRELELLLHGTRLLYVPSSVGATLSNGRWCLMEDEQ